jgi:hypothetical protein
MVERAIQTDAVTVTDIATSTPKKMTRGPEIDLEVISPIKPCKDTNDQDYKTSDRSFAEAEEEEIEDGKKLVAEEKLRIHTADVVSEKKYIVFHNKLLELFECCPICAGPSHGEVVNRVNSGYGTMVKIEQTCDNCTYTRTWDSQPSTGQMPLGNLILSATVLFSGCQISQILRLFSILNIKCFSRSTFQRHQIDYVIPTIINGWKEEQADIMDEIRSIKGGLQGIAEMIVQDILPNMEQHTHRTDNEKGHRPTARPGIIP